jgi:hypothetical protein
VSTEDWTVAAAAGQVVAAAAAITTLFFVGVQIRIARKTADLQALQEFVKSAAEREACLLSADTDAKKQQAFFEFLNFLEMNAAAVNGDLFHGKSRTIAVDKLCTSIAVIQEHSAWRDKFNHAITASTTFEELAKFMRCQRKVIECRSHEFRTKIAATSAKTSTL